MPQCCIAPGSVLNIFEHHLWTVCPFCVMASTVMLMHEYDTNAWLNLPGAHGAGWAKQRVAPRCTHICDSCRILEHHVRLERVTTCPQCHKPLCGIIAQKYRQYSILFLPRSLCVLLNTWSLCFDENLRRRGPGSS